jgi:ATP-dependent DNA helicase RecQ
VLNDGGWGGLVKKGLEAGEFPDALVSAAAELVGKRWRPNPPPTWVTCVPSTGVSPVPLFAERLAGALGLPFRPVVGKTRETKPQTELENSHQQFRNVWGAFAAEGVRAGEPVLLVDDLVDSR